MHSWIGLTVAQVLSQCGASYEELRFVDEPPGKLRELVFDCKTEVPPRRVAITIEYDSKHFSAQRSWPRAVVEGSKITAVRDDT